jgi:iron complex transport system ATP-binding protein
MRVELHGVGVVIDGSPIVDDVTLSIAPGSMTALIGPNGAGKSTLLRTVYRALRPTRGAVLLNGDDTWRLSAREAGRRRAVVAQAQPHALDYSVREIVAIGRTPHKGLLDLDSAEDHELVDEALRRVDMAWAANRRFATLSGGEAQRALLARAIAQQAPLLILDEPTNHLDVSAQFELLDLVRNLGVTTMAAIHDLNLAAAYADQIVVLAHGRLAAHGEPAAVLTAELIERVFRVRTYVGTHPLSGRLQLALEPIRPSQGRHP